MKFKCTVAYDGTYFIGWQRQPKGRSVEGEIEKALHLIAKTPIDAVGSGRTDAQVHALGQVFHFESQLPMDSDAWKRALNALLPKDIRIVRVEEVASDFHARFHASSKRYQYIIHTGMYDVMQRHAMLQLNKPLDIHAMRNVIDVFVGTHDFTSFNATELAIIKNQVRTITRFELETHGQKILIHIEGSGFLRYMVRMLVAVLIEVGLGKLTKDQCVTLLEAKDKTVFTKNVPAHGLYLMEVTYDQK